MRLLLVALIVLAGTASVLPSQRVPEELYRGPLYVTREARFIEPQRGTPLEFYDATINTAFELTAQVRSKTLHTIDVSGITLRLAFGPTALGMITFRMVAADDEPLPSMRILPDRPVSQRPRFKVSPQDITPGPLALRPSVAVAVACPIRFAGFTPLAPPAPPGRCRQWSSRWPVRPLVRT